MLWSDLLDLIGLLLLAIAAGIAGWWVFPALGPAAAAVVVLTGSYLTDRLKG